jgi:ATP-dependent DNA ligase
MLRPPVAPMGATAVERLPEPDSCPGGCLYEPKWEGWRALMFCARDGVYLQSAEGLRLDGFADLAKMARKALLPGAVLDGELVVWDEVSGHTSRAALQEGQPAHYLAFDLLQAPRDDELLGMPLSERRRRLTEVLSGAPARLQLCPQTADIDEAREWLAAWRPSGVQGLVVKGRTTPYRPGEASWRWTANP